MVLVNLGTNTPVVGLGWYSYDPVNLRAGRQYLTEVSMSSTQSDLIYSRFVFRYAYPSQDTVDAVSLQFAEVFFNTETQYFPLLIWGNLDNQDACTIQVQRFPLYREISVLADLDITVQLDPNNFINL